MPFVAPCRRVSVYAPWHWLMEGFADLRKAPLPSLGYGLFIAVLIISVTVMAWQYGSAWIMFSMLCGFVFIAPLSCIGIYAISAQLERNQSVSMERTLRAAFRRYIGIATAGLGLVFLLPAVGHGVWHGYLDTIDAQRFPRHEVGITATARSNDR